MKSHGGIFAHTEVVTGYQLGPELGLSVEAPIHGLSVWPGFLTAWHLSIIGLPILLIRVPKVSASEEPGEVAWSSLTQLLKLFSRFKEET